MFSNLWNYCKLVLLWGLVVAQLSQARGVYTLDIPHPPFQADGTTGEGYAPEAYPKGGYAANGYVEDYYYDDDKG